MPTSSLSASEMRTVLLHELGHIKRRDGLASLLQAVVSVLYFFHPLLWWANRQLNASREEACDELTVQALDGRRRDYGSALLKVAEILGYAAPPLALGVLDSASPAKHRIRRILDPDLPAGRVAVTEWCLLLTVAIVLVPGGTRPAALPFATWL